MVPATERLRPPDGDEVQRRLHHTDGSCPTALVTADAAGIGPALGDVVAGRAQRRATAHLKQGLRQLGAFGVGGLQQIVGQARGGFRADARKTRESIDQAADGAWQVSSHLPRTSPATGPAVGPRFLAAISCESWMAWLMARRSRFCNCSTCPFSSSVGAIDTCLHSCIPLITMRTAPRPALASTGSSAHASSGPPR